MDWKPENRMVRLINPVVRFRLVEVFWAVGFVSCCGEFVVESKVETMTWSFQSQLFCCRKNKKNVLCFLGILILTTNFLRNLGSLS